MRCPAACLALLVLLLPASGAAQWSQIGPYGGDVRALAADPSNFSQLFLGTSNGQIYASANAGRSWIRWSQVAPGAGYVVDDILVDAADPRVMYVGAWQAGVNGGGGVFKSTDGGRSWHTLRDMAGRSVRALVQARHRSHLLVAGTLEGVFRSKDAGRSWERISPPYHPEIRNIESLALDPNNPQVIYAGTWHLPWKTSDGGLSWHSIKKGMLDDSDVFSFLVDRSNHRRVFASACSGIYQSNSAGAVWRKIQGIPHSARRTRVLRQDPVNPALLYAGTTEGLWKTSSAGRRWQQMTSPRLVINDILIDPHDPAHLLLGTDRAGVLESVDGGKTFRASNQGFSHRHVSGAAFDPATGRVYAAVVHDRQYGGVFFSDDRDHWQQLQAGLEEQDVSALVYAGTAEGGRLLAGLRNGGGGARPGGQQVVACRACGAGLAAASHPPRRSAPTAAPGLAAESCRPRFFSGRAQPAPLRGDQHRCVQLHRRGKHLGGCLPQLQRHRHRCRWRISGGRHPNGTEPFVKRRPPVVPHLPARGNG